MNILSLILGIAAIVFAVHSLQVRGCLICCTASGGLCSLALLCQLIDLDRLARISDTAAIYDTAHARVTAGTVLLVLVLALNILALLRSRQRSCGQC